MDWISVKDSLPITEGCMIESCVNHLEVDVICFDDGVVYPDVFQAGNTREFWGYFTQSAPSHWMPLPKPPADEVDVIQGIIDQKVND